MVFTNTTEVRDFMSRHEQYIVLPESKFYIKGHYESGKLLRVTMNGVDISTDLITLKELDTNKDACVLFSLNYDYRKIQFMSTDDNIEITTNMYVDRDDMEIMPIAIMSDDKDSSMITWLLEIGLKEEYVKNTADYYKDQMQFYVNTKSFIPVYSFPLNFTVNPIITIKLSNAKEIFGEITNYKQSGSGYTLKHNIEISGKSYNVNMDKPYTLKAGYTINLIAIGNKSAVINYTGKLDGAVCCECGLKLVRSKNSYNCFNIDCKTNIKNAMRHIGSTLACKQGFDYSKLITAMVDNNLINSVSEMYDKTNEMEKALINHNKKRFHSDFKSAIRVSISSILMASTYNLIKGEDIKRICDIFNFKVFSVSVDDMSEYIPMESARMFKQWLSLNHKPIYALLNKLKGRSGLRYPKLPNVLPEDMVDKKIYIMGVYTMYTTKCYLMLTALGAHRATSLSDADILIIKKRDKIKDNDIKIPIIDGAVLEELITAYVNADLEDQFYLKKV